MNILLLANHLNIGGITSYLLTLATGLKKRGHKVVVAASPGEAGPRFIREGIKFVPIPIKTKSEVSPKVLVSAFKIRRFLKKEAIDIIHCNTRVTQVLSSMVSRSCRVPYVVTFHGFFKPKFSRKVSACLGSRVIAISEQVKQHLLHDFRVAERDIALIPNGIEAEKFLPGPLAGKEARKRLKANGGLAVGIVARLSQVKGHKFLIQAMKEVLKSHPQVKLIIAGEGKEKERLQRLAQSQGISASVQFLPNTQDTREVLWALDIFAMPSLAEGLGLGLMEAMAAGVAVVGSRVGGITTLIRDEDTGLLVKPGDAPGLALAITRLIEDASLRERLAKKGQDFIRENFSQDKMVEATLEVYAACLEGKV